ncbi:unnamed protein product [Caretta caretta]
MGVRRRKPGALAGVARLLTSPGRSGSWRLRRPVTLWPPPSFRQGGAANDSSAALVTRARGYRASPEGLPEATASGRRRVSAATGRQWPLAAGGVTAGLREPRALQRCLQGPGQPRPARDQGNHGSRALWQRLSSLTSVHGRGALLAHVESKETSTYMQIEDMTWPLVTSKFITFVIQGNWEACEAVKIVTERIYQHSVSNAKHPALHSSTLNFSLEREWKLHCLSNWTRNVTSWMSTVVTGHLWVDQGFKETVL